MVRRVGGVMDALTIEKEKVENLSWADIPRGPTGRRK